MKVIISLLSMLLVATPSWQQPYNSDQNPYHGLPLPMQEVYKYMRHLYNKENQEADQQRLVSRDDETIAVKKNLARPQFVTQIIQLRQTRITVTSVTVVTATKYQTCTSVVPGTPPCFTLNAPAATSTVTDTQASQSSTTTDISNVGEDSTSASESTATPNGMEVQTTNVPVLLPSCNCDPSEYTGGSSDLQHLLDVRQRTPRLLQEQQDPPTIVITQVTTVTSTATHTVVDPATTVAVTYGGCVPTDAITTTVCV